MSAGLAALLDDIAVLAKMAAASVDDVAAGTAKASAKAVGVVVDDTAVTPRYVAGVRPQRELPIIGKIAKGSLRNKILIIMPLALILSQFLPWVLTPILMLGGTYLCFEGAEKIWEKLAGHHRVEAAVLSGADAEKSVVSGAIRTDFILSAEIMVIALNEVAREPLFARAVILLIVAVLITALVYGVVAVIVKMDDVGLALARRDSAPIASFGRGLVSAMPVVLSTLSAVGVVAMCWVGGHIVLSGIGELGWSWPYGLVHHLEHWAHDLIPVIGGAVGWTANTLASAVFGVLWGGLVVAVVNLVGRLRATARS
jgi:predicted DNA repair protein MutK